MNFSQILPFETVTNNHTKPYRDYDYFSIGCCKKLHIYNTVHIHSVLFRY